MTQKDRLMTMFLVFSVSGLGIVASTTGSSYAYFLGVGFLAIGVLCYWSSTGE